MTLVMVYCITLEVFRVENIPIAKLSRWSEYFFLNVGTYLLDLPEMKEVTFLQIF